MGLLDDFVDSALTALMPDFLVGSRYWNRGKKLLEEGERVQGRIVGIEVKNHDTEDRKVTLALQPTGGTVVGTRVIVEHEERMRLGLSVPLRVDGRRRNAVLDWPSTLQRGVRRPPAPGVEDTSLDWTVKRRLKKGTPARGTITALERRRLMGMDTQNWDVDIELPDGSVTRDPGQVIPFYAVFLAVPGTEVPLALDAKDPSKASVDWAAAANEAAL